MSTYMNEFEPPPRLLMGAGPCNVHPRVLRAMTASMLGHLDPDFLLAMDDVRAMLREVFQTKNALTLPVSGTGTAGMEAAVINVMEPGDTIVVGANGYFASRLAEIGRRCGANVVEVPCAYGDPITPAAIKEELVKYDRVKAVAVVHAETSTGVLTPIVELAEAAHEAGALLIVDAVTSLGGVELRVDEWGIDVCYSGTQKCLACPPGLAPITFSERALDVMDARKTQVQSFYLDMSQLRSYWQQRAYHHTAPITMIYALREGLRIVLEEGIERRWHRHAENAAALRAGVEAMGLGLLTEPEWRLPSLTAIHVPDGVVEADVRKYLLQRHNLEISGGLGELAGRIWRIGLMGYNSSPPNVFTFLSALEGALMAQGYEVPVGESLAAAQRALSDGRLG